MTLSGYVAGKPNSIAGQLIVEYSRRSDLTLNDAPPGDYCLDSPSNIGAQFTAQHGLVRVLSTHFYPAKLAPELRPITQPGMAGLLQYIHHVRDLQNFGRDVFASFASLARLRYGAPSRDVVHDGDRTRAHAEMGDLLQEAAWDAQYAHMAADPGNQGTTAARLELRLQAGAWNFAVYESGLPCGSIEDWANDNFIAKELVAMGYRDSRT